MKLPPDVTHQRLITLLERHGYRVVRHLHAILNMVASHLKIGVAELLEQL